MKRKQEVISYFIWGIISSLLNAGLFKGLLRFSMDYRIANIITLIAVKIFCYFTNKFFVFKTPYKGVWPLLKEIASFTVARTSTFVLDFAGVLFLVEVIGTDAFIAKCVMMVIVVIVNYVMSKKFVFKKEEV